MSVFKEKNTFEKRRSESERIMAKYPDRIPIIVEVAEQAKDDIVLDKYKYLVPCDIDMSHFIFIVRKRVKLEPEKALFMFFGNTLCRTSNTVGHVYKENKDKDGFLYAVISLENTFG